MDAKYWHQKWDDEKIGFHQAEINKRLVSFWQQLSVSVDTSQNSSVDNSDPEKASCVFVPLCGKSQDMLWLHQQGHQVLGIELSNKAAQAFFTDNHLSFETLPKGQFTVLAGTAEAAGITIMVGDYFALTPEHCKSCTAFYDRASMIAMSPDMRERYTQQLATLLADRCRGLLLTISYDQTQMQGPPFSVSDESVQKMLGNAFIINELAHFSGPERVGNLKERGLETLDERVYLLERKVVT
ncbi:MAG: thiopurine S-methyltransferase [Granulosicoccus sp.]